MNRKQLEQTFSLYPQRIIIIRHGQVSKNATANRNTPFECSISIPCVNYTHCIHTLHTRFISQSEGNVDNSLYAVKPDREMALTPLGVKQAYVSCDYANVISDYNLCGFFRRSEWS